MNAKTQKRGRTFWSQDIPGSDGNYKWPVTFDVHDGYVGIFQPHPGQKGVLERPDKVLLSPAQMRALVEFWEAHK